MLVLAALLAQVNAPDQLKDYVTDLVYSKGRMLTFEVTRGKPGEEVLAKKAPYEVKFIASQGQIREESDSTVAIWDGTKGLKITKTETPSYWRTDLRSKLFDEDSPISHTLLSQDNVGGWAIMGTNNNVAYRRTHGHDVLLKINFSNEGRLQRIVIEPTATQPDEIIYKLTKAENFVPNETTFSTQPPSGLKEMKTPTQ